MMPLSRCLTILAVALAALASPPLDRPANRAIWAGQAALAQESDPTRPSRHFRVERPADLSGPQALTVYNRIFDDMVAGYRISGDASAAGYRTWARFNSVPFRSETHGERYVNTYANGIGEPYGRYEAAGTMPRGTILAKDSFAVTTRGDVFSGPLFLMEKMAPGFKAEARDWRYTMIMPDGSVFGVTNGQGSERVEFCIACHEAAGDQLDHLFFPPEDFRQKIFKLDLKGG